MSIRRGATEVTREGIVVIRVNSVICLKGTKSLQIKEASKVIKQSFAFKEAFLAFNTAILAFIIASLLLILRRFLAKFTTFTSRAASLALA